ncbi:anaphase-promoting complex subunit 4 [Rhopalosiphum padi]|uniref:anaphase-promoting complex subunit 4 n=1 Tax=Rhopalosiphum padi TaxID=40932 RepID=UPI00298DD944|nr:anaphase-promoting complex subunit 4 [Rhopalosiphum padi]XP_060843370.1 anaphase-promoting complex subunit 4 [Rhopalosiphum padi]XP_060843371.1 anaphase-promoting complex subunit 4 [Rhopalosiphum padi]
MTTMYGNGMKQLEERHVPTKVLKMEWSNKMDLLAIAKEHGEVSLHRLTWQRVWSLAAPKDKTLVTALAWRPDGKQLAIAYDSLDLLLVDVENKDIAFSKTTESKVTSLVWVQQEKPQKKDTIDSVLIKMNGLDYLPKLQSLVLRDTPEEENKIPKVQDTLNLLLVGMSNCEVQILALGIFLCGSIKLAEVFKKECTVLNIHMPVDFSYLYVAIQYYYGTIEIVTIKLQDCDTCWDDVYDLAFKHDQLLSSLDYLDQTMKNILETWEHVSLMEMELKLSSYCPEDPEMVSTDLLELLIYGILTERMDQFLKRDLTDKGIKKIGLSIESSHTNVQKLVVNQLSEVTNQILFQLVEISGMSLKKYECLGLTEHSVKKALRSVNGFLMKCNEVQIVIEESLTRYKLFFKWLYGMMIKLNDDNSASDPSLSDTSQHELNMLAEYINGLGETGAKAKDYKLDRVGQYFLDGDLEFPYDARSQWWSLLQDNPCMEENELILAAPRGHSLTRQFAVLKADLMDIFAQRKTFFDKTFVMYDNVPLEGPSGLSHGRTRVSMVDLPNHKLLVCCVRELGAHDFGFYELMAYGDTQEVTHRSTTVFYSCDGVKQNVHDVQFYSPDYVSVLTETLDRATNRFSLFIQLSTSSVRSHCSTDGLTTCRIGQPSADSDSGGSCHTLSDYTCRVVENMAASSFAVSGTRKVAVLLSHSRHKVRLFEMEVDDEEDEDEDSAMDITRDSNMTDETM